MHILRRMHSRIARPGDTPSIPLDRDHRHSRLIGVRGTGGHVVDSSPSRCSGYHICSTWDGLHRADPDAHRRVWVGAVGWRHFGQEISRNARPSIRDGLLPNAGGVRYHADCGAIERVGGFRRHGKARG